MFYILSRLVVSLRGKLLKANGEDIVPRKMFLSGNAGYQAVALKEYSCDAS